MSVSAAVVLSEDFNEYGDGTSIIGQNGGSGWSGAWSAGSFFNGSASINTGSPIEGTGDLKFTSSVAGQEVCIHRAFNGLTADQEYTLTWSWVLDYAVSGNSDRMYMDLRNGDGDDKQDDWRLQVHFRGSQSYVRYGDGTFHDLETLGFGNAGDLFTFSVTFNPGTRAFSLSATNVTQTQSASASGNWTGGFNGEAINSIAFSAYTPTDAGAYVDDIMIQTDGSSGMVPEPATMGLSLLSLAVIILFRGLYKNNTCNMFQNT